VVEHGSPLGSKDDNIDDLVEGFKPTANAVLVKVDVELILHASLDP
jgi:hypothetical protein